MRRRAGRTRAASPTRPSGREPAIATERTTTPDVAADHEPPPQPAGSVSLRPPLGPPGRGAWIALALVALGLITVDLGGLDLWAPDEPRYARVADELLDMERGASDLVLLRLGGEPYTQKPPLYFWLAAALGSIEGGVSETSARWPSAFAALATLAVWIAIASRLHPGTPVGWMTAALLLTSFRFIHFARRAQLDALLVLFESIALLGFLLWRQASGPGPRRSALALLHGATALALLTKGPVGLLPWACFVGVVWSEGRLRDARSLFPLWGVFLALAPVLAWIAASVALAPPGFFEAAVVDNLWGRFATGTAHVQPFWYFVRQLPVEALPWSLLWPVAGVWAWRRRRSPRATTAPDEGGARFAQRLLFFWIALPFVFFSVSAGKRGIYLLPTIPALCMALANWIERVRSTNESGRRLLEGPALPIVLCVTLAAAAALASPLRPEPAIAAAAFDAGRAGVWIVAAAGVLAALVVDRRGEAARTSLPPGLVVAGSVVASIYAVLFFFVLPRIDPEKSPRPIAAVVAAASSADEAIGLFDQPALRGGLHYYLSVLDPDDRRAIVNLPDADAVATFVGGGGRIVVARTHETMRLDPVARHRKVAELRSGRRAQSVIVIETTDSTQTRPSGDARRPLEDAVDGPPRARRAGPDTDG